MIIITVYQIFHNNFSWLIIIIIIIISLLSFLYYYYYHHHHFFMIFLKPKVNDGIPWTRSDRKFSQVSKTLLSILARLNISVVWILSKTVPSALTAVGITVTRMFNSCFFHFVYLFGLFYFHFMVHVTSKSSR